MFDEKRFLDWIQNYENAYTEVMEENEKKEDEFDRFTRGNLNFLKKVKNAYHNKEFAPLPNPFEK